VGTNGNVGTGGKGRMKEIWDSRTRTILKMALDRTPIHFLGVAFKAEMKAAYETGLDGMYLMSIAYGPYALNALVVLQDPDLRVFLDYQSVMLVTELSIENAITEYDSEKSPYFRGV